MANELSSEIQEYEKSLMREIENRDHFEISFSRAFEAATGREMVWSSEFGVNEALLEIQNLKIQVDAADEMAFHLGNLMDKVGGNKSTRDALKKYKSTKRLIS